MAERREAQKGAQKAAGAAGGHGEKRSRQEEAAILALLEEPTIKEAARRAGIADSTLRRWLSEPDFAERYRAARRDVHSAAMGNLQALTHEATEALRRNLTCALPAVEVSAARAILEAGWKSREVFDQEERIAALEEQLAAEGER